MPCSPVFGPLLTVVPAALGALFGFIPLVRFAPEQWRGRLSWMVGFLVRIVLDHTHHILGKRDLLLDLRVLGFFATHLIIHQSKLPLLKPVA